MAVTITNNGGGATAAINVTEGGTAVTTVVATRPDLVYSITGGADAGRFSINASTGALTFVPAPNYEVPTDFDANNTYIVEVTVTDPVNSSTDVQTITITVNNVTEGSSLGTGTVYYVATNGNDSNNGTSTSTPWLTLAKATSTLVAGETCYIKAGNYGTQKIATVRAGTTGEPISFIGYTTIPGDNPAYGTWDHTLATPDTALMPCIDAGLQNNNEYGVILAHAFTQVSGITISRFQYGLTVQAADCAFTRIYTREHGRTDVTYSGKGIEIKSGGVRCVGTIGKVVNANAQGITLNADNCVLDQMGSYASYSTNGPDYYFITSGSNNTVTNTVLYRDPAIAHTGHGLHCKAGTGYSPTGNVFDGFTCSNMGSGACGDRHVRASGNTWRNGTINGGVGIMSRDGGNGSTYEDIIINGCAMGIIMYDSNEDSENTTSVSGKDNLFQRITMNNVAHVIGYHTYVDVAATASGNTFDDITVTDATYLYKVGHFASATNILQNSTLTRVTNKADVISPRVLGDNQTAASNVTLNNCGFTLP